MSPFALLLSLAGLSHREAADFIGVSIDSVRGWINGRRSPSERILGKLRALIAAQARAANKAVTMISEQVAARPEMAGIEIGYPADDAEAHLLGFPCVSAWKAMAARVIAQSPVPVALVPRGSTVSTAAASDAHGK